MGHVAIQDASGEGNWPPPTTYGYGVRESLDMNSLLAEQPRESSQGAVMLLYAWRAWVGVARKDVYV